MSALVARLRPRWDALAVRLAPVAGRLVGQVGRGLPGVAGPLCVAYGAYEIYGPAGWIALGGFLLALDRRIP